jgi:hypothetical protein
MMLSVELTGISVNQQPGSTIHIYILMTVKRPLFHFEEPPIFIKERLHHHCWIKRVHQFQLLGSLKMNQRASILLKFLCQ